MTELQRIERSIIGNILLKNDFILETVDLKPEFFSDLTLQSAYTRALELFSQGKEIDKSSFSGIQNIDFDFLLECISFASSYSVKNSVEQITKEYRLRQAQKAIQKVSKSNPDTLDVALKEMGNELMTIDSTTIKKDFLAPSQYLDRWLEEKAENLRVHKVNLPLKAFEDNDVKIGAGWLTVIAARPKQGKSTLALQIAINTAKQGKKVVFFSLEMSAEEIYNKAVAQLASISPTVVANWGGENEKSQASQHAYTSAVGMAMDEFKKLNFLLYAETSSIWDILNMIRREEKRGHIDLIVIDQLSFVQTDNQFAKSTKVQEYDYVVRQFKVIAKDTKTPVILLAQLNREVEKRGDEMPKPSDLKDSGGIEETADMIMLLHKKEDKASVFITSRHEASGRFDLKWHMKQAKFEDI